MVFGESAPSPGLVVSCEMIRDLSCTSLQSWWPAQGIYELVTWGFDEVKVWDFMCEEYLENSL